MFAAVHATPPVSMRHVAPQMATVFTQRTFFIAAPFVGNSGFDPLGLAAADEGKLATLRHAEVKHGRLVSPPRIRDTNHAATRALRSAET